MKQRILRTVGGILLVPLFAVISEAALNYLGIYKSPHPWPLWFKAVAIICAMVGGPIWELASLKRTSQTDESQDKHKARISPSVILRVAGGATCGLLGVGLFIWFLIRCATASNPDAAVPGKEMLLGVLIPLLLGFVAACFFTSLEGKNGSKKL